jgi:hypothetical protein
MASTGDEELSRENGDEERESDDGCALAPVANEPKGDDSCLLPLGNIRHVMKRSMGGEQGAITGGAAIAVQRCTSEFISLVASEARNRMGNDAKAHLGYADVMGVLTSLNFKCGNFRGPPSQPCRAPAVPALPFALTSSVSLATLHCFAIRPFVEPLKAHMMQHYGEATSKSAGNAGRGRGGGRPQKRPRLDAPPAAIEPPQQSSAAAADLFAAAGVVPFPAPPLSTCPPASGATVLPNLPLPSTTLAPAQSMVSVAPKAPSCAPQAPSPAPLPHMPMATSSLAFLGSDLFTAISPSKPRPPN